MNIITLNFGRIIRDMNNYRKYAVCFSIFVCFSILNNILYANEVEEYIKEFFMKYLSIQINEEIFLNKCYYLPQFIGYVENKANFVLNKDNEKLCYTVFFTESPLKIYAIQRYSQYQISKRIRDINEIKSREEIFEKIKPLLEYFELPEKIEEYKFYLSPAKDTWRVIQNITYEEVPYRMAGFKIDVLSDTCEITSFVYVPVRVPTNIKPQLDTETNAREIAKKWLIDSEYFKKEYGFLGDVHRYVDESKKGKVVITFPVNAFVTREIPKEKREFMYAWEIPFIWKAYGENKGVIWVDVETQQVVGAGPYEWDE